MTSEQATYYVLSQVHAVSTVLIVKYRLLRWSALTLILSLFLWLVVITLNIVQAMTTPSAMPKALYAKNKIRGGTPRILFFLNLLRGGCSRSGRRRGVLPIYFATSLLAVAVVPMFAARLTIPIGASMIQVARSRRPAASMTTKDSILRYAKRNAHFRS